MSEEPKFSRHECRERAFKLLFAKDFEPDAETEAFYASHSELEEIENHTFVHALFAGTCEKMAELDREIEETAVKWKLSRMSVATRSILRLAAYEITATETPAKVVINEALEIIKLYDDESAPAFINGILNKIAHSHNAIETQA